MQLHSEGVIYIFSITEEESKRFQLIADKYYTTKIHQLEFTLQENINKDLNCEDIKGIAFYSSRIEISAHGKWTSERVQEAFEDALTIYSV